MSGVWNNTNIKIGHPKKITSTTPLTARRINVPNILTADWSKVSRRFHLLEPRVKGNRFW